jgi:DNA-binding beta-propeller fold protein YncE
MRGFRGCVLVLTVALAAISLPRPAGAALMLGLERTDPGAIWDVNPLTGASSNRRSLGINAPMGIAASPTTGELFMVPTGFAQLYKVNPATGASTAVGPLGTSFIEGDIAFSPAGVLYACYGGGNSLYSINTTTGAATSLGSIPGSDDVSALTWYNGQLLALDTHVNLDDIPRLYTLNPANGQVLSTVVTNIAFPTPNNPLAGMAVDPDTNTLYVAFNGPQSLYTLNPTTGVLTAVGALGFPSVGGLTFLVPEPTAAAAMAMLTALLGVRRRRRTPVTSTNFAL